MAIIYYPSNATVLTRTTTLPAIKSFYIGVSPNNIFFFDTASNLSAISSSVTDSISASFAITASSLFGGRCNASTYEVNSGIYTSTGSGYTFTNADNGKVILVTGSDAGTFTLPASLVTGWNTTVFQSGSGQMTFATASTSIYLRNRQTQNKTAGQYAMVSLFQVSTDTYVLSGDTA